MILGWDAPACPKGTAAQAGVSRAQGEEARPLVKYFHNRPILKKARFFSKKNYKNL